MGSEFALAVVLLAGAGLMVRTFLALQHVDPGFDPHGVLSMVVGVSGTEQAAAGHTGNFYQEVLQRVSAVPGSSIGQRHQPSAARGRRMGLPVSHRGPAARASGEKSLSPPTGRYFPATFGPCGFRFCAAETSAMPTIYARREWW